MVFVDIEEVVKLFKLDQGDVIAAIEAGEIPVIQDRGRIMVPEWFIEPLIIVRARRANKALGRDPSLK